MQWKGHMKLKVILNNKSLLILAIIAFYSLTSESLVYAKSFEAWKKSYAKRASKRGLPKKFVLEVLSKVKLDKSVIEKDRNQIILSKEHNYNHFMKRWLREDNERVKKGKTLLKEHHKLLSKIEKRYKVDKEAIVSLWGVETFYGEIVGDYNVIQSLATLAYDGRRKRFFEIQLNAALRLIKKGHVKFEDFKGSWAGATGQCQFMPSNIPVYGQDFNKDGKIDLWGSKEDIFASIAYFLKRVGWKKGKSIGSLIFKSKHKYRSRKTASEIPMKDSPIIIQGKNFNPLLKWNNSTLFAAFNILLIKAFKSN